MISLSLAGIFAVVSALLSYIAIRNRNGSFTIADIISFTSCKAKNQDSEIESAAIDRKVAFQHFRKLIRIISLFMLNVFVLLFIFSFDETMVRTRVFGTVALLAMISFEGLYLYYWLQVEPKNVLSFRFAMDNQFKVTVVVLTPIILTIYFLAVVIEKFRLLV